MSIDLLFTGAAEIFTGHGALKEPEPVLAVSAGEIAYIGPKAGLDSTRLTDRTESVDVTGSLLTPGLVDPHTHVVFAGDRSREYAMRAAGRSYLEIAHAGGGIASTMRATREASVEQLVALGRPRLDRLLSCGVTTAEVKSGYGLSFDAELRLLEAIHILDASHPIDLVPTFLGAHTIPPEFRDRRQEYIREVTERMIPAVAERGLADFCDVFVEKGAFSVAEAEYIFEVGRDFGLIPKVHADQLSAGGGAELAARVGAASADHLEFISDAGIDAMIEAGTVGILLPGAALFLNQREDPPARRMIDAGMTVALATDCNPGTCMTENLLLMLTLGMSRFGMSPTEVMQAVTLHAAHGINRQDRSGTLTIGHPADVSIFAVESHEHLPYHFGVPHCSKVFKDGVEVYTALS